MPGGLAADAELEEDGVGAVDAGVRVGGGGDFGGAALAGQDAPRERGDDVEPVRVEVDQSDLGEYMGMTRTWGGSIIMVMTQRNAVLRPLKRNRASAYAIGTLDSRVVAVAATA